MAPSLSSTLGQVLNTLAGIAVLARVQNLARLFAAANRQASRALDAWAERLAGRHSGAYEFSNRILPDLLRRGLTVLDAGSGKHPTFDLFTKRRWNLTVVGLDISSDELEQAPAGAYDETIVGDVSTARLPPRFDLIVSRTLLEHVRDCEAAVANLASGLAPGGRMAHFMPCGNAPFARLNMLLGNRVARRILFAFYGPSHGQAGFPAYYDRCTPLGMSRLCSRAGLQIARVTPYYRSEYCHFLAPAHAAEVTRQLVLKGLGLQNWAETFTIVAERPAQQSAGQRWSRVA